MNKILNTCIILFIIIWYTFFGFLKFNRASERHTDWYTDSFYLTVAHHIINIQKCSNNANDAWSYIKSKDIQKISLNNKYYYNFDVIECHDKWFIVVVPSQHERFADGIIRRLVFLDFAKIKYPLIIAIPNSKFRLVTGKQNIETYKNLDDKCTAIDVIPYSNKSIYEM